RRRKVGVLVRCVAADQLCEGGSSVSGKRSKRQILRARIWRKDGGTRAHSRRLNEKAPRSFRLALKWICNWSLLESKIAMNRSPLPSVSPAFEHAVFPLGPDYRASQVSLLNLQQV